MVGLLPKLARPAFRLNRLLFALHSFVSCVSSTMHRAQRFFNSPCCLVHSPPQRSQYFSSNLTTSSSTFAISPVAVCVIFPPLIRPGFQQPTLHFGSTCFFGGAPFLDREILSTATDIPCRSEAAVFWIDSLLHEFVFADNQLGVWFHVLVCRRGSPMFCVPLRCLPSALIDRQPVAAG